MLGDNNWLRPTIGLITQRLSDLFKTLQSDKDFNNPRKLSAEADKELVEKKITGCTCGLSDCILVILPLTHSSTGILKQSEDNVLEWIFLAHKQ